MASDVGTVNASEDNKEFQDLVMTKFLPQPSGTEEAALKEKDLSNRNVFPAPRTAYLICPH